MQKSKVLLSFIGYNDAGKMKSGNDGAILTVLSTKKYDTALLLWNENKLGDIEFHEIARYLKEEITKRGYTKEVGIIEFSCQDVADHNTIYPALKSFCDSLPKDKNINYVAHISSGTPAMQVCWILLAESGDFSAIYPLNLIRSIEPRFGKEKIKPVKLDTSLPKIISLKKQVETLEKEKFDLIPEVIIQIKSGSVFINKEQVPLSPIEYTYYRYFADNVLSGKGFERFSGLQTPVQFVRSIIKYHEESYPEFEHSRIALIKILKQNISLEASTFRSNVSKINMKIRKTLTNTTISKLYEITSEGKRHTMYYGIKLPAEKIVIK